MEFIQLVSQGPWRQIWLAAHCDKRVKPEDVFLADIEKITASVRSRKDVTNLRSTGHLVLGACRIYRRKTEMYESQVTEVRNKLVLAFTKTREKKEEPMDVAEMQLLCDVDAAACNDLTSSKSHTARLEMTTQPRRRKLADAVNFNEEDVSWKNPEDSFDTAALEKKLGIQPVQDYLPIDAFADSTQAPAVPYSHYTPDMPLEHDIGQEIAHDFPPDDPMGLSPRGVNDLADEEHPLIGNSPMAAQDNSPIVPEVLEVRDDEDEIDGHKSKKRKLVKGALVDNTIEIPAKVYYQFTTETEPITLKYPRRMDFRLSLEPYMGRFFMDTSLDSALFLEVFGDALYVDRRNKLMPSKEPQTKEEIPSAPAFTPDPVCLVRADEPPHGDVPDFDMVPAEHGQDMVPFSPRNAHMSMSCVVTGGMDEEEFDGTRVGFSGRTSKMESLVRQEMQNAPKEGVCYRDMCQRQGGKNRHLVAACFFELLVLKTNGVVDVKQDQPYGGIMITEGRSWQPLQGAETGHTGALHPNDVQPLTA